jgi:preprotein translocase subunit SecD
MLSTIRNRLILIGILVATSIFWLIPRDITIRVRDAEGRMSDTTVRRIPLKQGLDLRGGIHLALELDESAGAIPNREDAIDRAVTVIRTRIDEFGVAEPLIQKVGNDRIVVELAGIDDPGRAKQIVQRAAFLEFRITDMQNRFQSSMPTIDQALVRAGFQGGLSGETDTQTVSTIESLLTSDTTETDSTETQGADSTTFAVDQPGPLSSLLFSGQIPGEFLVPEEDVLRVDTLISHEATKRSMPRGLTLAWASEPVSEGGRSYRGLYAVDRRPLITGAELTNADATIDPTTNQAIVRFELSRRGGRTFQRETRQHINDYMAIMLDGRVHRQPPIIRGEIGRSGQIELGRAEIAEAQDLALVLRAGSLPAPLQIVDERNVGATLGADSIRQGRTAAIVASVMVVLIMLLYYRRAGMLAVVALLFYVLFTLGGLATLGATLTLPGLAGFVLSLGIAVDANVLIFERIREELKLGKTSRVGVESGFASAMPAIIDANVTTVTTAAFLFQFGTGPVKGFAVTLIVGIVASLITAVFVTKTLFLIWLQRRDPAKELSI